MSRIDVLLQQLCPNGVEFRRLGDLGKRNKGTAITAAKMKELREEDGSVRVFAGGQTVADIPESSVPAKDIVRVPSIIVKSRGHIGFTFYERPFTHKAELWSYSISRSDVDQKFIYYYLLTQVEILQAIARATSVKLPQLGVSDTDNLLVPVPPLEVQREIVRVLDTFSKLEAELEAELEARRKQYTFYREQLLKHDSSSRWGTLAEVGQVHMCKRIMKEETNSEQGVPFYKIGTFGKTADAYISQELYQNYRSRYSFPRKGEVLISAAGTIGRGVEYDGSPGYFQDSNIVWISNNEKLVLNRYLFHWYRVADWTTDGGTVQRLYNSRLLATKIRIPALSRQAEVVSILDKFDILANDLSSGLPAELNARRQQYEHYRDRLLTFQEAT